MSKPRVLAGLALGAVTLVLAGCQSGGSGSVLGSAAEQQPPAEKVRESELRAYCPPVVLREGTAYFNTYQRDGQDDPEKLIYQASIADVTRSCTYGDGTLTMNVAVAGRVVPGPAGAAGNIDMPIRIVVTRGEEVLYTQLHLHPVAVGESATQFIFNDPNVSFPIPTARNIRVFAGYDEGPEEATQ